MQKYKSPQQSCKSFVLSLASQLIITLTNSFILSFLHFSLFSQNSLDNLQYQYNSTNNRLNYITDAVSATTSTDDIDNQASGNYSYNAIGELSKDEAEGILEILWNPSGKVKQVSIDDNKDNVADRKLEFKYDALGNRMKKIESDLTTGISETIFYVRNAIGEVISIYQDNGSTNQRIETTIADIGTDKITSATSASGVYSRSIGEKNYELKDQLGNVRVVISDIKEPSNLSIFQSSILNSTDYYSYGMKIPGRDYNSASYRYGFNGKEKDNELKGNGNSYDFGARILDSRVGRWMSTDPLEVKFPSESPYSSMADNPVVYTDPDGKEVVIQSTTVVNKKEIQVNVTYRDGKLYNKDGSDYDGNDDYIIAVQKNLNTLNAKGGKLAFRLQTLEKSKNVHLIRLGNENDHEQGENTLMNKRTPADEIKAMNQHIPVGTYTLYNPFIKRTLSDGKTKAWGENVLAHELLGHAFDYDQGITPYGITTNGIALEEVNAVKIENLARGANDQRNFYGTPKGPMQIPAEYLQPDCDDEFYQNSDIDNGLNE